MTFISLHILISCFPVHDLKETKRYVRTNKKHRNLNDNVVPTILCKIKDL